MSLPHQNFNSDSSLVKNTHGFTSCRSLCRLLENWYTYFKGFCLSSDIVMRLLRVHMTVSKAIGSWNYSIPQLSVTLFRSQWHDMVNTARFVKCNMYSAYMYILDKSFTFQDKVCFLQLTELFVAHSVSDVASLHM